MKTLKTPSSVWSRVFRRIATEVEVDPELRRVVPPRNFRSWKGVPDDRNPFQPSLGSPLIRLTPNPTGVGWYSPGEQSGTLVVKVELAIMSTCIEDVSDLWDMVVTACKPSKFQFTRDLIAEGAETGEIVFSDPAIDSNPEAGPEGFFLAIGRFRLVVIRSI